MTLFKLYISNARRQKVSDFFYYSATDLDAALAQFREDKSWVDWLNFEVVAAN